jgi:hypothetical protein
MECGSLGGQTDVNRDFSVRHSAMVNVSGDPPNHPQTTSAVARPGEQVSFTSILDEILAFFNKTPLPPADTTRLQKAITDLKTLIPKEQQ